MLRLDKERVKHLLLGLLVPKRLSRGTDWMAGGLC